MYETNTTDDGGIGRLRQLEATALVATVLAFGLTALLVPASAATEANGVAATLLGTIGWTGAGIVAVVGEAALFAGWRRLSARGYPRAALGAGAGIAAVGVADVLVNLVVLSRVGLPETARLGEYGGVTAIVLTAAASVYLRAELRVLAAMFVYALWDVTSGLSGADYSRGRAVGMAFVLVLSAAAAPVALGPLPAVDKASADAELLEDFEDQDWNGWSTSGTIVDSPDLEGEYSGSIAGVSTSRDFGTQGTQFSWSGQHQSTAVNGQVIVSDSSSAGTGLAVMDVDYSDKDGDEKIEYDLRVGNDDIRYLGEVDTKKPHRIVLSLNGDYSEVTGELVVGGQVQATRTVPTQYNEKIGKVRFREFDGGRYVFDNIGIDGGAKTGVGVDGTLTDSGGNGISDGTLELRQNGSVVKSTTSNSTGGYAFSGVSDGDYSLRASAPGYRNASKFITVSGSPVTADLTMSGQLQGIVRDGDGNPITDANVTTGGGTSTTTNGSGGYDLALADGSYTVEASADGYQTQSQDVTVSGATSLGFSLSESGTFEREFQLGPSARQTYPPSLSTLHLYRFDRAVDFPLPGGTTFEAGPGTWTKVESTRFNSEGAAYARLQNGEPYRVDVVATSGPRQTRWESLGWRANASRPDPYGITVGSGDGATPTETSSSTSTTPTTTPTGGGGPTVDYPDLEPPSDPFDLDDDDDYYDEPDGSGGNVTAPSGGDGFGPRLAGECLMADGTSGVLVEFWDPDYQTTELEYNLSAGNNSYAGARTFDTPAGYATWCVADGLTNNASDSTTDLTGNVTQNGTTTNFSDTLDQSAVFGGPIGGGGGGGEPSTGQQVVGIGLSAGAAYLLVRRFTDFRLSEAASTVVERLPVGGGGS